MFNVREARVVVAVAVAVVVLNAIFWPEIVENWLFLVLREVLGKVPLVVTY